MKNVHSNNISNNNTNDTFNDPLPEMTCNNYYYHTSKAMNTNYVIKVNNISKGANKDIIISKKYIHNQRKRNHFDFVMFNGFHKAGEAFKAINPDVILTKHYNCKAYFIKENS